jgi:hypothetical protein
LDVREPGFRGYATGKAVETLATVIGEREKTKRLLIGAACLLFIVAALVVIFAPPDKQGLAYALGGTLVVIALGAIGAAQFQVKLPGLSIQTHDGTEAGKIKSVPEHERRM